MENRPGQQTQAGSEQGLKIVGREFRKLAYSLFVWISDNKLECRCSFVPHQKDAKITTDELKGYLAQAGVKHGIFPDLLDPFTAKASSGQKLVMELLAQGTPPVDGEDGRIEYLAQSSTVANSTEEEEGRVDMYRVLTFINVRAGDEIGRLMPPTSGTAGMSVSGVPLPQKPGIPLKYKLGTNIRLAEDGLLFAEAAGRVCDVSGEISVAEEYIVAGDVNFRVGSIDFNGFVEVRGDVLDGFSISARKGMRIHGIIGACDISSDGDISFCGMNGQKRGTIRCGGSLTANYIHETDVECNGDVHVEVELHNSLVKCLGRVFVNRGAISGGACIALGGIEAKKAGSAASVVTELFAGIDYRDKEAYEQLLEELEKNAVQLGRARASADQEAARTQRSALMEKILEIRKNIDQNANPKINIKDRVFDNTLFGIGLELRERVTERSGPFSAIANSIEGGVRFAGMSSLNVSAAEMELTYLRQEELRRRMS